LAVAAGGDSGRIDATTLPAVGGPTTTVPTTTTTTTTLAVQPTSGLRFDPSHAVVSSGAGAPFSMCDTTGPHAMRSGRRVIRDERVPLLHHLLTVPRLGRQGAAVRR
jgi:hypothetical protein